MVIPLIPKPYLVWLCSCLLLLALLLATYVYRTFLLPAAHTQQAAPCVVAVAIPKEQAQAKGYSEEQLQQLQGTLHRSYPCGDEAARAQALQELEGAYRTLVQVP